MNDPLGRPLELACGAVLENRLAKAAMTEGLADRDDRASAGHERLYRRWSQGGAGLLITGNVMVDRRYLERPGNVVIDENGGRESLRRWAAAGTSAGNHLWMQISHPGRQCSRTSSLEPLSPSDVGLQILGMFARPRAMTEEEILDALERYAHVAEVARDSGFTGVQVHGAHGYLINQFLSPITNRRQDGWGGSLDNRARFLLEAVRRVRQRVGDDFPVAVKLNSSDFQKGGFSDAECVQVVEWLGAEKVDLLELSGGNYEQPQLLGHQGEATSASPPKRESTRKREAYFLEYAKNVRKVAKMPLMVTGGFRARATMVAALESGDAQVIGMARPLCVDTDLPRRLIDGQVQQARAWEDELRLGPGAALGPLSSLGVVRSLNAQGDVSWFYRQIVRLAEGGEPDPELSMHAALVQHYANEIKLARRRTTGPWAR